MYTDCRKNGCLLLFVTACSVLPKNAFSDRHPIAGPVDIVIKSIEECPKKLREGGFRLHQSRGFYLKRRPYEYFWTANISLLVPIDDTSFGEVHLAQLSPRGSWKSSVNNMRFPLVCSTLLRVAGPLIEKLMVAVYKDKLACPLPPVNHAVLQNFSINTKQIRVSTFVYGRWRGDVLLVDGSKIKGCIRVYTDMAPAVSAKEEN